MKEPGVDDVHHHQPQHPIPQDSGPQYLMTSSAQAQLLRPRWRSVRRTGNKRECGCGARTLSKEPPLGGCRAGSRRLGRRGCR
jgi:hypothetical protein